MSAQLTYRPGQEYRSLNTDYYEIAIQKNGLIDVTVRGGRPVFLNAFPMVRFENKKGPEPLQIDGRYSRRYEVDGPLGRGNGMLLKMKNCEWSIQVYPSQPFLAVHVTYVNTTKKPVSVTQLMPWCVGEPRKGAFTLGGDASKTPILVDTLGGKDPRLSYGATESDTHLAALNPVSGHAMVAGFLSQELASTTVSIGSPSKKIADRFDSFRAVCTYDPPIVVEPGGRLKSEVFYIAVAERDALVGLERYARALSVVNGVASRKPTLLHGWEVTGAALNESTILEELDSLQENLARFGWSHVSIGDGWQKAIGDWEPDASRFPGGMHSLVAEIHRRGLTAGLWIDPFVVDADSALAKEHPDWLLEAGNDDAPEALRVLDVSLPAVIEFVEQLGRRARDWGFDAITGVNTQVLLDFGSNAAGTPTRVVLARAAIGAWLEGIGPGRIAGTATPSLLSVPFSQLLSPPRPNGAIGSRQTSWASFFSGAARRYYFAPHLWSPSPEPMWSDGQATSGRETTSSFTAMSMLGGSVRFAQRPSKLQPEHIEIMRRVLPPPSRPARPLDLFFSDDPKVWVLPIDSPIGRWHVVAVFNWDQAERETTTLPFSALGLNPDYYFTVYDFWADRYYGTARDQLDVDVPPGGVRVLGLRRYRERPMFLGTESHLTQGAAEFTALDWDKVSRRLSGSFDAIENVEYGLRFLIPEGYEAKGIDASVPGDHMESEGRVLKLQLIAPESGTIDWSIQF